MTFFPMYLFCGIFTDDQQAQAFVNEQWTQEPEDLSDEEYAKWEDENPEWRMEDELEFYMDSDFVELSQDLTYILTLIESDSEKQKLLNVIPNQENLHLIIVGKGGFWGDKRNPGVRENLRMPEDSKHLKFLGRYNWR